MLLLPRSTNIVYDRSCLKLKLLFALVYFALLPTMATGLISKTTASVFRRELTEGITTNFAGKGLPRTSRDLTDEERDIRQQKLAEYDAQKKRVNTGKWTLKLSAVARTTEAIKNDTVAIKADTEAVLGDTKAMRNILEGKETGAKPGQSDKERLKELRTVKRQIDNEIGDVKERELKRMHIEKTGRFRDLEEAAATAEACCDFAVAGLQGGTAEEKKADWKKKQAAVQKALNAEIKAERAAAKTASKPKAKAKGKARVKKEGAKDKTSKQAPEDKKKKDTKKDIPSEEEAPGVPSESLSGAAPEKPDENASDPLADSVQETPEEKPAEKAGDAAADSVQEKPEEKPEEKAGDVAADSVQEKPGEKPEEKPCDDLN